MHLDIGMKISILPTFYKAKNLNFCLFRWNLGRQRLLTSDDIVDILSLYRQTPYWFRSNANCYRDNTNTALHSRVTLTNTVHLQYHTVLVSFSISTSYLPWLSNTYCINNLKTVYGSVCRIIKALKFPYIHDL